MRLKKFCFILLCFAAISGCREPFEFDFEEVDQRKVVIEGFISDLGTQHAIKVSYTATLDEFGVEGRLLTMTEDDYNFWDKVRRLAENTGGLFDAAPFSLEGNITNRNTGELALGYFGVYRESIDRQFFQLAELGVGSVPFPMCTIPPFATLPHPCEDCRVAATQENFGIVRPLWWGN